jgi:hypothetical protein
VRADLTSTPLSFRAGVVLFALGSTLRRAVRKRVLDAGASSSRAPLGSSLFSVVVIP